MFTALILSLIPCLHGLLLDRRHARLKDRHRRLLDDHVDALGEMAYQSDRATFFARSCTQQACSRAGVPYPRYAGGGGDVLPNDSVSFTYKGKKRSGYVDVSLDRNDNVSVPCPLLIVYGNRDRCLPLNKARDLTLVKRNDNLQSELQEQLKRMQAEAN